MGVTQGIQGLGNTVVFSGARNGIHSVDLGRVFVGLPVLLQQSGKKLNK